jgi:hypothetical protein
MRTQGGTLMSSRISPDESTGSFEMAYQAVSHSVMPQSSVSDWSSMIPGAPVYHQAGCPGLRSQVLGNVRRRLASRDLVLSVSPGHVSQQPKTRAHCLQRPARDPGRRIDVDKALFELKGLFITQVQTKHP